MTPDQFQRDVIDILGLFGKGDDEKIAMAKVLATKANNATTIENLVVYELAAMTVCTSAAGYSLETIFQMALDKLEEEYGHEKK